MTVDESGDAADRAGQRELDDEYWCTLARTADLVRNLSSLADRYDRAGSVGDPQDEDRRRAETTRMRAAAEAGRQLIRSLAPPALRQASEGVLRDQHRVQEAVDVEEQAAAYALITQIEQRALVRQAQGVLMQAEGMTAGEAFAAMVLAAVGELTLVGVAAHVVQHSRLPARQDVG